MGSSRAAAPDKAPDPHAPPPGRLARIIKAVWWLHSFWGLAFGIGIMVMARAGLAYGDKLLIVLGVSWLLLFVALRFIVGPENRRENEGLGRKGVRVVTNYFIKNLYQQMFYFLVPLYASSATWSLSSPNWWIVPLLLIFAVLSTLDLVFDNFIMERRLLAAAMYALAMFALLNVLLPVVAGLTHLSALIAAAAMTPPTVALLSFRLKTVLSPQGTILTVLATGGLLAGVYYGRVAVPPAPMAVSETAVGHGTYGSYECLPPSKHVMRADRLDGLRCGSLVVEPGGLKEDIRHRWRFRGRDVAVVTPERLTCDGDGEVFRSALPAELLPGDPIGRWTCLTETVGGQLVGMRHFVVEAAGEAAGEPAGEGDKPAGVDGGMRGDGGVPVDAGADAGD